MGNFLWNFAMLSLFMGVLILLMRIFSLTIGRKIHASTRYLLWVLILLTMRAFSRIDAKAGDLLIPYLLWVTFAGYLNFGYILYN